jgi:hypothetical protein
MMGLVSWRDLYLSLVLWIQYVEEASEGSESIESYLVVTKIRTISATSEALTGSSGGRRYGGNDRI